MTDTMDSRRFASDLVIDTREISQSLAPPMCELVPCRMTRTQKSILVLLALLKFVAMGLFSVIAPYYHLEAHQRQLSDVIVGAVFTAYAGANFLTSPIFGRIIAETGPQIVLLLGSSLLGISAVSFSFLTSVSDPSTFCALSIFVRTLQGIGCGAAGTAIFTYVAEVFPRRTGIIMGVMEVMTAIGLNAGPAVGGYLHSVGGFKLPSLVLGFMCLATVPLNAFLLPRSINAENCVPKTPRTPGGRRVSKWTLLINVQFIVAALSTTAVSCASAFLSPLLAPQLSKLGMNTSQIGMMFLFSPIAYGLVGPIAGWISDENPKWRRLQTSAGLGLLCIALLLLGPSPIIERILRSGVSLSIVALCIKGLGSTIAVVPTFQIMLDTATNLGILNNLATHSMISGLWSSAWSFGEVLGPTLGTVISSSYGFGWASTVLACWSIVVMILMILSHFCRCSGRIIYARFENLSDLE